MSRFDATVKTIICDDDIDHILVENGEWRLEEQLQQARAEVQRLHAICGARGGKGGRGVRA